MNSWLTVILIGTSLASAGITVALHRLWLHAVLAWVLGSVSPAAIIIAVTLILELREPIGPFWAALGLILALAALPFGFLISAVAAILSAQLRLEREKVP